LPALPPAILEVVLMLHLCITKRLPTIQ